MSQFVLNETHKTQPPTKQEESGQLSYKQHRENSSGGTQHNRRWKRMLKEMEMML